jgi:hypothetical protein
VLPHTDLKIIQYNVHIPKMGWEVGIGCVLFMTGIPERLL